MTKSHNKVLLGSTTLLAMGVSGAAAQAASTNVGIDAVIVAPIQMSTQARLNFGSLTDSGVGGTATVDTAGVRTVGGATSTAGGTVTAGSFTIKAQTGRNIDVTTPVSVNITETAGGVATMLVNQFSLKAPAAAGGATNTAATTAGAAIVANLTAATVAGFTLGGTLNVGAAQLAGTYQGQVQVTAVYQ